MYRVRRVDESEWRTVREVRLRALADSPASFGSSLKREVAFSDDLWIDRLCALTNATFLCAADQVVSGIVTMVRDEAVTQLGWLVGMWVAPSARSKGAADELVASVLTWAELQRMAVVRLHVTAGNARAERLYVRHGFARTGEIITRSRDGVIEVEMEHTITGDGPKQNP